MSVIDGAPSSRTRANRALQDLEVRILGLLSDGRQLEVRQLRHELAPKLSSEDRSMMSFAIHHLLNQKKLVMTANRKLGKPDA